MSRPGLTQIDPNDITPQLDGFISDLPDGRLVHVRELVAQLRDRGNRPFTQGGDPEAPIWHLPALLDDESFEGARDAILGQEDVAPTVIVAGNVGSIAVNEERKDQNVRALEDLGRLCARQEIPFSFYDTTYKSRKPRTPIGTVRADMHAAGLLLHRLRAQDRKKPPKDVLLLGSDVDVVLADPQFVATSEDTFRASGRPAWLGTPDILHAAMPDFPNISRLFALYDAFSRWTGPQHYAVNAGAYAAAEGIDPNDAYGEFYELIRRVTHLFGKENVARESVDAQVVVSGRQLAYRMVKGGALAYAWLHVPGKRRGESYRNWVPTEDVTEERMHQLERGFIEERKAKIHEARYAELMAGGMSHPEAVRHAEKFANALVNMMMLDFEQRFREQQDQ